jgi:hypothetical protein
MKQAKSEDIAGREYDWIASDPDGRVGFFSTAGAGCAPASFMLDTDVHERAIELILAAPARCRATFAPVLGRPDLENTWERMAERGVFAFDGDPNGGPYRLVARPTAPMRVSDLPEGAREVAEAVLLPRIRFARVGELPDDALSEDECEP